MTIYSADEERRLKQEFSNDNAKAMSEGMWTNICLGFILLVLILTVMIAILGLTIWSPTIAIIIWLVIVGVKLESYTITVPALQLWVLTDNFQKDPNKKLVAYGLVFTLGNCGTE